MPIDRAATLIASALAATECKEREDFLLQLVAHATAGLIIIIGNERAAEKLYAVADQVVAKGDNRG